jgi:hypothetical protein
MVFAMSPGHRRSQISEAQGESIAREFDAPFLHFGKPPGTLGSGRGAAAQEYSTFTRDLRGIIDVNIDDLDVCLAGVIDKLESALSEWFDNSRNQLVPGMDGYSWLLILGAHPQSCSVSILR